MSNNTNVVHPSMCVRVQSVRVCADVFADVRVWMFVCGEHYVCFQLRVMLIDEQFAEQTLKRDPC